MASAPCRVYAVGVFDLFHSSHLSFFWKAKAAGGPGAVLVIGVMTDVDAGWKRPPVVPHAQRVALVSNCRLVDEVIPHPPLHLTAAFLDEHQISCVVHGDDDLQEEFFKVPRARGIMRYVPYTRGGPYAISTSDLIARIRGREDLAPAPAGGDGEKGEELGAAAKPR